MSHTVASSRVGTPLDLFAAPDIAYRVLPSPYPSSIGSSGVTANQVRAFGFYIPVALRITSIHFRVSAASALNFASVGIYTSDGNSLLIDSGPVPATAGLKSVVLGSPVVLLPGFYLQAWTVNNGAVDMSAVPSPANLWLIINGTGAILGIAANPSVGGQLPASLGVITPTDVNPVILKLEG